MTRQFTSADAGQARAQAMLPLLVGLCGPSGSGKTFSALRIASGIQSVVGGDIFVIDTEQRRSLHYADRFAFKHVPFAEPFGALDYLEALRFAKKSGAGVVVIDSCSHEHDGPGGLLEQHEKELDRMAGNDWKKRDRVTMLAWQKPKAGRRKLIAALTSELDLPAIFCFRAKQTTKPVKSPEGKIEPVDMGFTTIGADEWMFEMALSALLLPGSCGVPTWHSDKPGERLAIKLPEQFAWLRDPPPAPLDEAVGRNLALWAKGGAAEARKAPERFQASEPSRPRVSPDDWADNYIAEVNTCQSLEELAELQRRRTKGLQQLAERHPSLHERCLEAGTAKAADLRGPDDDDMPIDDAPADGVPPLDTVAA